jgi:hypothetical protein
MLERLVLPPPNLRLNTDLKNTETYRIRMTAILIMIDVLEPPR